MSEEKVCPICHTSCWSKSQREEFWAGIHDEELSEAIRNDKTSAPLILKPNGKVVEGISKKIKLRNL